MGSNTSDLLNYLDSLEPKKKLKKLLIWGRGGHAKVIKAAVTYSNAIDNKYIEIENIDSSEEHLLVNYPKEEWDCFVAIGDNKSREKVFSKIQDLGYITPNIWGSLVCAEKEGISENSNIYLGPYSLVHIGSTIGKNCIINSGAIIDHDCIIGDHTHIAPGSTLCGNVKVGTRCFIGPGSTLCMKTKVANSCIVGAGSTVIDSLYVAHGKYWGTPAKLAGMQPYDSTDNILPTVTYWDNNEKA